jgi:ribosomal protein S17
MNAMRTKISKLAAMALLPVVLLALTSCSSTPAPAGPPKVYNGSPYTNEDGFGGEVVVDSISRTATVVSVDRAKRLVVLKRANGSQSTYKALPGALGFDDIKAGDVVKVSVAEELAMFLGKNSVPASAGQNSAKLRVQLPGGVKAFGAEVQTLDYTGKVMAIDAWNDAVTLQLPDGLTKTIKVSEAVNLADVNVGDAVSVRATEAAVIVLDKP